MFRTCEYFLRHEAQRINLKMHGCSVSRNLMARVCLRACEYRVCYMVCGCIDVRARVNYFSRNNERRYRLRNPCATGYASKVNIMHPFLPPSLPPSTPALPLALPLALFLSFPRTFSLLSPFSSATKGGFVARRGSTKPYTHPLNMPVPTPRRAFASVYKRVRARVIRQRCNTVLRAPLSYVATDFVFRRFCVIDPRSSPLPPPRSPLVPCNSKCEKKVWGYTYP